MILPSDEDGNPFDPPKKGKGKDDPDQEDLGGFFDDLEDDDESSQWRADLQRELLASFHDLKDYPDPESDFDPPEPPDLYTFFTELMAMRHAVAANQADSAAQMRKHSEVIRKLTDELKLARKSAGAVPPTALEALASLAAELDAGKHRSLAAKAWAIHKELGGRKPGKSS